jgi:hypothetical protein
VNVLLLSPTFDIGGQGHRIKEALERAGISAKSMAGPSYHAFPEDLPLRRPPLHSLYQWADLIHCRTDFRLYDPLAKRCGPKPLVIHHHGTTFRNNSPRLIREQRERNAVGIVSTLDLWLLAPNDTVWLPAPYDIEWLASL